MYKGLLILILLGVCLIHSVEGAGRAALDSLKEETLEVQKERKATRKKGDKLYDDLGYMASTAYYEQLAAEYRASAVVLLHLANSYRLNGEFEDAEYWYGRAIRHTDDPEDLLHYAQMLMANGKCLDAVRWYEQYQRAGGDQHRSFVEDCDALDEIGRANPGVRTQFVRSLNSTHLDFSPIPFEDGVVITSTRGRKSTQRRIDTWTQDNFTDLYYIKTTNGKFSKPKPLGRSVNDRFHDGVPTFSKGGREMIFTRNNTRRKSSEGLWDLQLYSSKRTSEGWSKSEPLNINDREYASAHPALSADNKRLYFASNRPGGYGGMDIYVSRRVGSVWQTPENLGPIVNSAGNEVFPYVDEDDHLYYSSDGHRGLGGLDLFVAQKSDRYDESSWSLRENLGTPINSRKDDFGFVILEKDKRGYLSSNRDGGKGADDILKWTNETGSLIRKSVQHRASVRNFCLRHEVTEAPVSKARVTILPASDEALTIVLKALEDQPDAYVMTLANRNALRDVGDVFATDENGGFSYPMLPDQEYIFVIEKNGFTTLRQNLTTADLIAEDCHPLSLAPRNCLPFQGRVVNARYQHPIPNATIKFFDACSGEIFETQSDARGLFEHCLTCGCGYEAVAEKAFFQAGYGQISTVGLQCDRISAAATDTMLTLTIELMPRDFRETLEAGQHTNDPTTFRPIEGALTPDKLREYFLGDPASQFREGQVLVLHHVYYDFDRYAIRPDAAAELQYVAALMRHYPSMRIGLESHTDARGTQRYNDWLSGQRARSAQRYLEGQGIAANRLEYALGKGERELTNHCTDGQPCSETEHQENRRTEIKLLHFDVPNVRVETRR